MDQSDRETVEKLKKLKVVHLKEVASAVGISPYGTLCDRSFTYHMKFTNDIEVLVGRKASLQTELLEVAGLQSGLGANIPKWQAKQLKAIINAVYDKNYLPLSDSSKDPSFADYLPDLHVDAKKYNTDETGGRRVSETGATKSVRCICLNDGIIPDMIQCRNQGCGVWQHLTCVGQQSRERYLCEHCRFLLADPFHKTVETLLPVAKLKPLPGMPPIRDIKGNYHARIFLEQAFFVSAEQLRSCRGNSATQRVTISCMHLEDNIPCRMHWPKNISLHVNNLNVKPYTRGPSTSLGINQRDSSIDVTRLIVNGRNSLRMTAVDNGAWLVKISISDKQSKDDVKAMMLRPETLEEAKARMRGQLAGDSEDAIGLEQMSFSLKDPLTCTRINYPARFDDASGPQAFDLDSYLSIAELNRKWQDPTTLKNSTIKELRFDAYSSTLLKLLESITNINCIEVNAEGNWRPEGYQNEWFDICQEMPTESLEAIALFAKNQLEGSTNDDETEDLQDLEGIDFKKEAVEALSALITLKKDAPAHAQPTAGQKREAEVEVIDLLSSDED